jgi:hypothetical protein
MKHSKMASRLAIVLACAAGLGCMSSDLVGAPGFNEPITPPEPPTTGNKWVEDETLNADGSRCFVLQDEECGGTDAADYLDYFEAPIFRTAHAQDGYLYAVDGSNIWILDAQEPTSPQRVGVQTGVGRALAVTGHNGLLYVAAADRGVAVYGVDLADPSRLVRRAEVKLAGPALDVALRPDGKALYAAIGAAGLAVLPLDEDGLPGEPTTVPLPGFASGVSAHGAYVYVAGCSRLNVVSAASLALLGSLKPAETQAPMPLKDVVVEQGVAAVAAGRWGVLFVDVEDPTRMQILGNHTDPDDLLYYGNGVAYSHGNFYLAAGDWGVDRVPLSSLRQGQGVWTVPAQFPRYCTSAENPDRTPAPQFQTVLPPPRNQDPLDVIPVGDALFAAGDASRLGLRALDVYSLSGTGAHTFSGRYEEPRRVTAIDSGGGRVVLAGVESGVYSPSQTSGLLERVSDLPEGHGQARTVTVCGDGRLATLDEEGTLRLQDVEGAAAHSLAPSMAAHGEHLVGVRQSGQVEVFRVEEAGLEHLRTVSLEPFTYGAAHAFVADQYFVASAAWQRAFRIDLADAEAAPVALESPALTRRELEDPTAWRQGAPTRVLIPMAGAVAEISSFGGQARAVLHPLEEGAPVRILPLPPGTYVGGTSEQSRLMLVQGDRARYRTSVVEVDLSDPAAEPSVRTHVFLGSAIGATRLGDVLYVADLEAGVRAFRIEGNGISHLGVADLGGVQ